MFLDDLITPEDQLGIDLADAEVDLIEQLIAIRKQRGLSQAQVAESMGVDRSAVTRFEKAIFGAKRPNITTVRRYATAVNAYIAPIVTQAENYSPLQSALRRNLKRLQEKEAEITRERNSISFEATGRTTTAAQSWSDGTPQRKFELLTK
ncbi:MULTISPECIES: helix-turn-helix domain-containing protein [Corynebacterium]|uniref:helix-turn-helix domain-containing protein n=1 Tax=Corynebacterium TaxID=1716 RepID=UPI0008A40714|nr:MULTISPECIES: helix-turn-helix transcriptional regulator [Corynebacterium]OFT70621.1 hypothetical protein HMPREF3130_06735 [Corynebacterium sp. HMSC14B06]STC40467.1 predicted transcriptional regulator [Corynebacterium amycolatum]